MTFYNSIPGYTLLGYGAAAPSCPTHPIVGPGTSLPGGACEYAQPGGANATITCGPGTSLNKDATSCDKGGGGMLANVKPWMWVVGGAVLLGLIVLMMKKPKMAANQRRRRKPYRPRHGQRKFTTAPYSGVSASDLRKLKLTALRLELRERHGHLSPVDERHLAEMRAEAWWEKKRRGMKPNRNPRKRRLQRKARKAKRHAREFYGQLRGRAYPKKKLQALFLEAVRAVEALKRARLKKNARGARGTTSGAQWLFQERHLDYGAQMSDAAKMRALKKASAVVRASDRRKYKLALLRLEIKARKRARLKKNVREHVYAADKYLICPKCNKHISRETEWAATMMDSHMRKHLADAKKAAVNYKPRHKFKENTGHAR